MGFGLLARNRGMTRYRTDDGSFVPVTILEAGPCVVVQKRTVENNGYVAVQLGFEAASKEIKRKRSRKHMSKPAAGHFAAAGVAPHHVLQEFDAGKADDQMTVGQTLTAALFQPGDLVTARATTKGRGFQGVIKRCGKHGGPGGHGSHFHRSTGSIGMRTWPGRTLKNTGMPGQMGNVMRSIRNLKVIAVNPDTNVVLVRGAVPGAKNGLVRIECPAKSFADRLGTQAA